MSANPHRRHALTAQLQTELETGLQLANAAVTQCVQQECHPVMLDGQAWYDTRPMLDPRERSLESLDYCGLVLEHAETAGLLHRHPTQRYMVRLALSPQDTPARQQGAR
jgi:hypothetical protein